LSGGAFLDSSKAIYEKSYAVSDTKSLLHSKEKVFGEITHYSKNEEKSERNLSF
jgi:hypothetical protein